MKKGREEERGRVFLVIIKQCKQIRIVHSKVMDSISLRCSQCCCFM